MEKVLLKLNNGELVVVNHDPVDKSFDDVMQFQDLSYTVKSEDGTSVPLRSILTYKVEKKVVANG